MIGDRFKSQLSDLKWYVSSISIDKINHHPITSVIKY